MSSYPWGGSEELWSQAALRLKRDGYRVGVSVHPWNGGVPEVEVLESAGIKVYQRRRIFPSRGQRLLAKLARKPIGDLTFQAGVEWLLAFQPNFMCVSDGGTCGGWEWMKVCRENKIPYVNVAQCNHEAWWPSDDQVTAMLPEFLSAKKCFFVSQRNRQLFETQIGEQLPNAEVVRNPFKVPYNVQVPWPSDADGFKLACVGRLDPAAKGQDLLLQVLAQKKWQERPLQVNLYGRGPCEKNLRKLVASLRPGQVEFKGHVSDVTSIWAQNHGLILPSRFEGLPLAVVEAMLCARMVIVTDVAGNAELLEAGKSGFVAAAPTVDLLDAALEEAWQRRNEWQAIGLTARQAGIRNVPQDPVGEFCQKLISLAGEK